MDEIQNNRIMFLRNEIDGQRIELIEKLNEKSSVYNFKPGLHHICYEVEDKENFAEQFKEMKIGKIFTKPMTAPAIQNRVVVFACLRDGSFAEFLF